MNRETLNTLFGFRRFSSILLSGTPLQNNLRELWSLLDFSFEGFEDPKPFRDMKKKVSVREMLRG